MEYLSWKLLKCINEVLFIMLLLSVLDHVKSFELPVLANKEKFVEESEQVMHLGTLLEELSKNSKKAHGVADDAQNLEEELQSIPIKVFINSI